MFFIDSEFCNTKEKNVTTVCAAVFDTEEKKLYKFWTLNNPLEQERFRKFCNANISKVWSSYSVTAEARYFLSLGLDPVEFKWVDLFLEYRHISNHNDRIKYGMQLVNGVPKMTRRPPPKYQRTEEDSASSYRQTHSLAEATYKLCGVIRDTDHKNVMRDIIISANHQEIDDNKKAIMDYCVEDTVYLENIYKGIMKEYQHLLSFSEIRTLHEEMLNRGQYSALTGRMESFGYPINVEATKAFSNSVGPIINECQREINELFPDIKPFVWDKKKFGYRWDQKTTKEWLIKNVPGIDRWMKTDKGDISLSLEAWQKFYDYKHDYPKDIFGAQMVRYLKLKQNLNGFSSSTTDTKKTFWDSVGSDGRVRPYMNHFGAQSSRSQPAATGFLFLKPAWMRSLCQPTPGRAVGGFDYGSQEFLISALLSNDKNMIGAYASGDVYLALAILAGLVPEGGKKEDFKAERDLCKATTLGISYLMTKVGLAAKLTNDLGREVSEDEAQDLIDLFYNSYPDFASWQEDLINSYMKYKEKLRLGDGWNLFPDNDNFRSAANFIVQGTGACVMRRAVMNAYKARLDVIFTLHDAIYIEYDSKDLTAMDKLRECMLEAFIHFFEDKKSASLIRLDGKTWSPDFTEDNPIIKSKTFKDKKGNDVLEQWYVSAKGLEISTSDIFVDERSQREYDQFCKYFENSGEDLL